MSENATDRGSWVVERMRTLAATILFMLLFLPGIAQASPISLKGIFLDHTYVQTLPANIQWDPVSTILYWRDRESGTIYRLAPPATTPEEIQLPKAVKGKVNYFRVLRDGLYITTDEGAYRLDPEGKVQLLPEGSNRLFSKDGNLTAFTRGGNIFLLDEEKKEHQLTLDGGDDFYYGRTDWVYGEELDMTEGMWFSPDSTHLAFIQMDERPVPRYPITDFSPLHPRLIRERYPLAGDANPIVRIGVVDLAGNEIHWLGGWSGEGYVARVHFSADGSKLYRETLNRDQTRLDLWETDLATWRNRIILTETSPTWINVEENFFPLTDGSFLWTSEKTGFRHIYHYDPDGKLIAQLTKGKWPVTSVDAVSDDGSKIIYTAARPSARERHAFLLGTNGAETPLTTSPGYHTLRVSKDQTYFIDYVSTWFSPTRVEMAGMKSMTRRTLFTTATKAFSELATPVEEDMTITSSRGTKLDAILIKPARMEKGKRYPVLQYVYGGPHAQVTLNQWRLTHLWYAYLAEKGFVVFMLDNRGSYARGKAWEDAISGEFGRRELEDQEAGAAYLKSLSTIDPKRIAIWGWSYGGYMTLYALTHSKTWALGIAVAPVTDWRYYDSIYTERYLKLPKENEEGYRLSSPIHNVKAIKRPLLICHGTSDDNVHLQNTISFIRALVDNDIPYTLRLYPGRRHGIHGDHDRYHLFSALTGFLTGRLHPGATPSPNE